MYSSLPLSTYPLQKATSYKRQNYIRIWIHDRIFPFKLFSNILIFILFFYNVYQLPNKYLNQRDQFLQFKHLFFAVSAKDDLVRHYKLN